VAWSSSSCAHDHDHLCIPPTSPAHKSEAGKKESTDRHLNRRCRPSGTPSSISSCDQSLGDVRTAAPGSTRSSGVNKSAKVVLDVVTSIGGVAVNFHKCPTVGQSPRCIVVKSSLHFAHIDNHGVDQMTRRATCSCGQLHLTIEGEPSRIAMCHCLECQRRTGAVISNQARFRRQISVRRAAPPSTGRTKVFRDTSPLLLVTSPTRISRRRTSQCGRSHVTPGSLYRPTHRRSASRSRDDKMSVCCEGRWLT